MIDALAALKTGQDFGLLVLPVFRNYEFEDGLADRLFRRIAEQALRPLIPTHDDAVQVLADDRVIRRTHDCTQMSAGFLLFPKRSYVASEATRVNESSVLKEYARIDQYVAD